MVVLVMRMKAIYTMWLVYRQIGIKELSVFMIVAQSVLVQATMELAEDHYSEARIAANEGLLPLQW